MRCNAGANGGDIFLAHRLVQHPFEIGVSVDLHAERSLRPTAYGGLDTFLFHVGALDQPKPNGRTTVRHARAGPRVELLLHGVGISEVRLQYDTGADIFHAVAVKRTHEGGGGEVHIAVFLHVEVNKFRHAVAIGAGENLAGGGAKKFF